ncbi:tyrosinase-like protein 2 [Mytilus trossulus]|uniref:tyrosinase-like protein 2 n=1 Tax=Mytilus trossulus TaxID=6551 RepID=UPI003007ED05
MNMVWISKSENLVYMKKGNELIKRNNSMESNGGLSKIRSYADCIIYDLAEAEVRNLSLTKIRQNCNELFIQQTQIWKTNMKDINVANYVSHLLRGVHSGIADYQKRKKRSIFGVGVLTRKEIREPPYDDNWGRYVKAVRRLKHSYDIRPDMNTYDVVANLHTDAKVIPTAHDGPGFFAWHREYLRIMEIALGCPIPYWDTTPDHAMNDPTESIVWSDKYFGNGYGVVQTGIMKNLPTLLPIIRNINNAAWLVSKDDIKMALKKPTLFEFTESSPCAKEDRTQYSWECFHKGIHDWISGTIGPSNTTTFDPIFFPIHAFIDKVFEIYRQKLISKGIDPAETYPTKSIKNHGPDHKMIWVPIFPDVEHLTNRQGYDHELAALTKYSLGPVCPHCMNSDDLYCDVSRQLCVSKERKEKDKSVITTIATMTPTGIVFTDTLEPDNHTRVKRLIERTGKFPFGKKFNVGSRDSRTRNDGTSVI